MEAAGSTVESLDALPVSGDAELLALDDVLTERSRVDERQRKIVEMKFFGGIGNLPRYRRRRRSGAIFSYRFPIRTLGGASCLDRRPNRTPFRPAPNIPLEIGERINPVQPSLKKLGVLLSQCLVIGNPPLFILAIDLHLIEAGERLQRSWADRSVFYDTCSQIIQDVLKQLRGVGPSVDIKITNYVREVL